MHFLLCFFATGAGKTVIMCLEDKDDKDKLKERLQGAWVSHVSLENGTGLMTDEVKDPFKAIGIRMLLQLLPNQQLARFVDRYINENAQAPRYLQWLQDNITIPHDTILQRFIRT